MQPTAKRLPALMRALELHAYEHPLDALRVVEKPLPRPGPGQVLVQMQAAAVNPSDLMFLHGKYGLQKPLPVVPGWEGSGVVVAAGRGLRAQALVGRRVACAATDTDDGTWAEYMVTSAEHCLPLLPHVSIFRGATMLVNPLTAWALVSMARRDGHSALVQTAAASALGAMIRRLAYRAGLTVIDVVRREEQVAQLRAQGALYVLNSTDPHFAARLREWSQRLGAKLAFDAVAGDMPGHLLQAMPRGTQVVVYGALAGAISPLDPSVFIFRHQQITGFWLVDWLHQQGVVSQLRAAFAIQRLLSTELRTGVRAAVPLEQAVSALRLYMQNMSQGKILLLPGVR